MAYDKQLHFIAGFLIAILAGYFFSPLWGLTAAIVAGLLKEVRDWYCYHGFDEKDMLSTWLGGLLGMIITGAIK